MCPEVRDESHKDSLGGRGQSPWRRGSRWGWTCRGPHPQDSCSSGSTGITIQTNTYNTAACWTVVMSILYSSSYSWSPSLHSCYYFEQIKTQFQFIFRLNTLFTKQSHTHYSVQKVFILCTVLLPVSFERLFYTWIFPFISANLRKKSRFEKNPPCWVFHV